jgi:hypothetical protein
MNRAYIAVKTAPALVNFDCVDRVNSNCDRARSLDRWADALLAEGRHRLAEEISRQAELLRESRP